MSVHAMIDIEALGLRPGSVILEVGCVLFDMETGKTGETFQRKIKPDAKCTVELDTLYWHERRGTWPAEHADAVPLYQACCELNAWIKDAGTIESVWSWGSTYDFPLLLEAYRIVGLELPWHYWQLCCARSVWRLAFGNRKHEPRPHEALADSLAACRDLMEAQRMLQDYTQDPSSFYRAGLRDLLSASILSLAGRCGLIGLTTSGACEVLSCSSSTAHHAFYRLVEAGLLLAPTRDSQRQGRPNRFMITQAGINVLSMPIIDLPR
jgi:hypothetical protein